MRQLLRAALVTPLMLAGCSLEEQPGDFVANRCATDTDCVEATCDVDMGMCVGHPDEELKLGLEVNPSPGDSRTNSSRATFIDVAVASPDTRRDLVLPAPIRVVGTLRQPGRDRVVAAEITFERASALPGRPGGEVLASTLAEPMAAADRELADYSVRLEANVTYDVRVTPTGEGVKDLPPVRFRGVEVPGGGDVWRWNIPYPRPEVVPMLHGCVIDANGPVGGLEVRAVEKETGRIVSSTGMTLGVEEADVPEHAGSFTVHLDPATGPWELQISAGSERPLFPTMTVPTTHLLRAEDGTVQILVPNLSPVRYIGYVERDVANEGDGDVRGGSCDDRPPGIHGVRDAAISFHATDVVDASTGIRGSFRTAVTTDSCGKYDVMLLPGTYEVVITPPGEVSLGVYAEAQRIVAPMDGTTVQGKIYPLPERPTIGGMVLTRDQRPMTGATVQANALSDGTMSATLSAARFARSTEALTDATGQFELRLDVGTYDVVVKPPVESGFAWSVRQGQEVTGLEFESSSYELPAPVPLRGQVLAADGMPVSGAEVRAFAVIRQVGAARSLAVARAITEEDGSYTLLLPADFHATR